VSDIEHRTNFTEYSFTKKLLEEYELEALHLIRTEFTFKHSWKKYIPFKRYLKIFFNGIYDDLLFEFEVRKS